MTFSPRVLTCSFETLARPCFKQAIDYFLFMNLEEDLFPQPKKPPTMLLSVNTVFRMMTVIESEVALSTPALLPTVT